MIRIEQVHKAFGEHVLFEDFNMEIEDGDFVVFSGPSGCGKTTLLNMIGALEPFDAGAILVDDLDISKRKNQLYYFSEKVGFLFQNFALMEEKTVKENLEIIKEKNRSKITIKQALKGVGLAEKLDSSVYTLSGGEQQRVALARLLLKKCDLVLADEPTGSLDKANAAIVMNIIKALNQMGKTIILVTHDEEIKKQGKRVVNL
ncbi:ATP-binding cassette domain-containing protein [Anaerovorax odorimutans]|uniref:ATP-binding cassette domain-containing protein n=1 Tax=Anaerovorax odorimutans TaxID=109327 RepID=A0ABT1RT83_9FIRM|nr:ATP-binding cassette domain-containing protein [Anaerovorax odorimutans]MCQ4638419.1 ATP-binding cassette domain-containing protein [Anaerovorax odorimutans]